ncbi:MAG: hypothetical protein AAFR27_02265, partial [Pseudomonadota bacterium]
VVSRELIMSIIKTLFATLLVVATSMVAHAESFTIAADHNGSLMEVRVNNGQAQIVYARPKASIARVGVTPGTVLFSGVQSGGSYSGQARVFRSGCAPALYNVSGSIRIVGEVGRRLTLTGAAPVRNGCTVTGYTMNSGNARLDFDLYIVD